MDLHLDYGTFRQLAVLMAMQGLLANQIVTEGDIRYSDIARLSVKFADALLEAMTVEVGEGEPTR